MSEIEPVMAAAVGAIVACLGWPVAHWLTRKRELLAEKRKTRVAYLLEAYRRLENAGNRRMTKESELWRDIESAIADIQLLGTPNQITLASEFVVAFAEGGTASFDAILYDLRNSLRKELDLEPAIAPLKFLRINWDGRA